MKHADTFKQIATHISDCTGKPFELIDVQALSGGDINSAFRLQGREATYFVKMNHPPLLAMFAAEQAGLEEILASKTLRAPLPIVSGATASHAFLVLEHLQWGPSTTASSRLLGQQLAQMHQQTQTYFGWHRDNTIGSTPQPNPHYLDWPAFWHEQRLGFQLELAKAQGHRGRLQTLGERLCGQLHAFFSDYHPMPSLLHGDLWGGNVAVDQQGRPVIFDPACYYGDREADLAMTELFGGFDRDFYAAYQAVWPLAQGFASRKILYNLYHVLNHLNLFGAGYVRQAENMLEKLLAELK